MDKRKILQRLKILYDKGGNVIEQLRALSGGRDNTLEDILISYELQAGSYIKDYDARPEMYERYADELANEIQELGIAPGSMLEVGCGEATLLAPLVHRLSPQPHTVFGFDLSWSRIQFAKDFYLRFSGCPKATFFTGDLFSIPLEDNAIDIVYTSCSIESNGGREKEALLELYRVTRRYLILLEPAYDFADEKGRERMKSFGYITELPKTLKELGYSVIKHQPFAASFNPLNPTGITIIEKKGVLKEGIEPQLVCPITRIPLVAKENILYAPDSFLMYPVVRNTPCLLQDNAIIAVGFLS